MGKFRTAELSSAAESRPAAPVVEPKGGFLRIPNTIVFNVYPLLKPLQRVVFEELYLFTHGFGRNPNVVSQKKIVRRCGISEKYVITIIGELVEKGFVRKLEAVHGGSRSERGMRIEVWPFEAPGKSTAGPRPAADLSSAAEPRSAAGPGSDMKENMKESFKTGIYEIRTIAARLFEAHRTDPGFDHERLRVLVTEALIGQGHSPNDDAIDEAIRGMATS